MRVARPMHTFRVRKACTAFVFGTLLTTFARDGQSQATPSPKRVLHVSAAADLLPVMPALAQNYEHSTGVKLIVTTGSSERQVARIEAGDPADIFLGADFTYPEKLIAGGLADAKAPVAYANGTLVLFAQKDSPLQPLNLERLQDRRLQKLAVADRLLEPFGRATAAALTRLKLFESLSPKFVVAEDVTRVGALVESGEAQLGFISLTLARSDHYKMIGSYILVPESQYPVIKEYAVVLRKGDTAEAHRFLNWLLSSDVQTKLPNLGLNPVH
jgi:molybdate transport system substrate-binding protein